MKSPDSAAREVTSPVQAVRRLLESGLTNSDRIKLITSSAGPGAAERDFHRHDIYEIFCPLAGDLVFQPLGFEAQAHPPGTVLIVPPGCVHASIDTFERPPEWRVLVMSFAVSSHSHGVISVSSGAGSSHSALTEQELARWTALLGTRPEELMRQVTAAVGAGEWGRHRALAWMRLLLASFAEAAGEPSQREDDHQARPVALAMTILQSQYHRPKLAAGAVADAVGLSQSHLARLFQQVTGHSLHQTLIDIRLRQAAAYLKTDAYPIKQIAAMTGWSNQLYFSAAFRRRYGLSPSAFRQRSADTSGRGSGHGGTHCGQAAASPLLGATGAQVTRGGSRRRPGRRGRS